MPQSNYPLRTIRFLLPDGRVSREWLAFLDNLAMLIPGGGVAPGPGITQLTGPVTTPAGGGVQPTTITPTGVTPGTYGDAITVGQFTVNAAGQLTMAANIPISLSGIITPLSPHYEPVTNGNPIDPELIFNSGGDVVMAWVGI